MKANCYMLRVFGAEYLGCEAALVMITQPYLHEYRETYVPAYKALREKDEGFMYLVTTDHMVVFIETVGYDIMNDEELNAEVDAFRSGNFDVAEIPRELFDKLNKETQTIQGYGYASIDDEGVHWTLNEKHTGTSLETAKLTFKTMEKEETSGTTHQS